MAERDKIKEFPKIELHCHLDGSISELALKKIIKDSNIQMEQSLDEIKKRIRVSGIKSNLAEYLSCFQYINPFLQEKKSLEIASYELIREAAKDHIIYIEVRFAPVLHRMRGLAQIEAVKAVLKGLETAERDFGIKSRLILCMLRGRAEEENEETILCAKKMKGYGVAGLDLAGNEAAYPPALYRMLFSKAMDYQIPFTIHAGECNNAEHVRTAIEMGASRIGHGLAIADKEEIKEICRKKGVVLELCPMSNLQTGAVKSLQAYPFHRMQEEGIFVTVNTDNRAVSATTLTKEWKLLQSYGFQIDKRLLRQTGEQAIEGAFLSWSEKKELKKELYKNNIENA